MRKFVGQTILITGASSGLGAAMARRFAREGARLVLVARRRDRLEALAAELRAAHAAEMSAAAQAQNQAAYASSGAPGQGGEACLLIVEDLRAEGAPERIVERVAAAGLHVDVLVNNAGVGEYGEFAAADAEALEGMLRLNVLALARLTRLVVPGMIERFSPVGHQTSLAGHHASPVGNRCHRDSADSPAVSRCHTDSPVGNRFHRESAAGGRCHTDSPVGNRFHRESAAGGRCHGGILNVASTASFQPTPYMGAYGASKAFVLSLSLSLWHELRRHGIRVTCLCPGPIETEFFDRGNFGPQKAAFLRTAMSAEAVAEAGIRALARGRAVCIPGLLNKIGAIGARIGPLRLATRVSGWLLRPVR